MTSRAPKGWNKITNEKELVVWKRSVRGKRIIELVAMKDYMSSYRAGEWYVYAVYPDKAETIEWVTRYVGGGRRPALKYALQCMHDLSSGEWAG
jgi:hypothetical protein